MKRNPAGQIVTAEFEEYRGHLIRTDKGLVTVGRMGHRAFASYPITSVAQAKALIDVWEDASQEGRRNAEIFRKLNDAMQTAA